MITLDIQRGKYPVDAECERCDWCKEGQDIPVLDAAKRHVRKSGHLVHVVYARFATIQPGSTRGESQE